MSHFQRHLFVCVNRREAGKTCCAASGGAEAQAYLKDRLKVLAPELRGRVRINSAGCLGRCDHGPVAVVYPDGVWYRLGAWADLDAILVEHLRDGVPVERLRIPGDGSQ